MESSVGTEDEWTVGTSFMLAFWVVLVVAVVLALTGIVVGLSQVWWAPFYWLAFAVAAFVFWWLTRRRGLDGWSLSLVGDEFVMRRWLQPARRWFVSDLRRLYHGVWTVEDEHQIRELSELTLAFEDGSSLCCSLTAQAEEILPRIVARCPEVPVSSTRFPGYPGPAAHALGMGGFNQRTGNGKQIGFGVVMLLVLALLFAGWTGFFHARPEESPVPDAVVQEVVDPVVALVPVGVQGDEQPIRLGTDSATNCGRVWSTGYWGPWDGDFHVNRFEWRAFPDEPGGFDEQAVLQRADALGFTPTVPPTSSRFRSEEGTDSVALAVEDDGVLLLLVVNTPESYGGKRWAQFDVTTPCMAGRDPPTGLARSVRIIADYLLRGEGR